MTWSRRDDAGKPIDGALGWRKTFSNLQGKMTEETDSEGQEGAAFFPVIPPDLGINPLVLAVLHATVFLAGSDDQVVHPEAAAETIDAIVSYLERMNGSELARLQADMKTLADYARREKWPKQNYHFLKAFLEDCGLEKKARRVDG
jgi:hypothetical protein